MNISDIPLRKQVDVITLSKVIADPVLLQQESGISQANISQILCQEEIILNRWLTMNRNQHFSIRHACDGIDFILFEWAKRKMLILQRKLHPSEIATGACVFRQQLDVRSYAVGKCFWKKYETFDLSLYNAHKHDLSLDPIDILNAVRSYLHIATYMKYKNVLKQLERKEVDAELSQLSPAAVESIDISDESDSSEVDDETTESIGDIHRNEDLIREVSKNKNAENDKSSYCANNEDDDVIFLEQKNEYKPDLHHQGTTKLLDVLPDNKQAKGDENFSDCHGLLEDSDTYDYHVPSTSAGLDANGM